LAGIKCDEPFLKRGIIFIKKRGEIGLIEPLATTIFF
jgi:hypothetical protein